MRKKENLIQQIQIMENKRQNKNKFQPQLQV